MSPIGRTPLVELRRCVSPSSARVFAKLEYFNPTGSVKDRIARYMVERALQDGRLEPGGVLVEASSGNTALGLAFVAKEYDLRCRFVVRRQTSQEKLNALRALGAELVVVDGDLPAEHPESYNRKALSLVSETPGAYFPDQHNNRENNQAHYESTGPEIWEQMEGRIDVLVMGIGTGGTLSGVARYVKERDKNVRVVAVDGPGSVFTSFFRTGKVGTPGRSLLEGLGDQEIIACPEFDLFDEIIQVSDKEAVLAARELTLQEGIFAGGSSGAALWAVRRVAASCTGSVRITTLFPDHGSRYLSSIFNDEWMLRNGFLDQPR